MKSLDEPPLHPLRFRVWRAREITHERACEAVTVDAGHIAHLACGIAGRWCFNRRATDEQLEIVLRVMRRLHLAAAQLDRLEGSK